MSSDRHRVLWLLLAATMLATAIGYQVMTAPEIDAGPKPPCMHEGKKSSQGAMLRPGTMGAEFLAQRVTHLRLTTSVRQAAGPTLLNTQCGNAGMPRPGIDISACGISAFVPS